MKKYLNKDGVQGYPEAMKQQPFCCWRWEKQKGRETKVPYDPKTGYRAKTDTPDTFGTMEEAMDALQRSRYSGIGFNISEDGPERAKVGCIDHDHCVENGAVKESVLAALDMLPGAMVEISPSGTGLHQFFIVPERFAFDKDVYYVNNRKGGKEIYLPGVTNHFMTLTGNVYRAGDMTVTADQLQAFLDAHMKRKTLMKVAVTVPEGGSFLSDEEVLYKLSSEPDKKFINMYEGNWEEYGADENWSQSDADMTVLMKLAFWCRGDMAQMDRLFRESGLMRDKWDRGLAGSTYGVVSMTNAINRCSAFYAPDHNRVPAAEDFEDAGEDGSRRPDENGAFTAEDFSISKTDQSEPDDHTVAGNEDDGSAISADEDISAEERKGDVNHSSDPGEKPGLAERLDRLLASAPSTDDLYSSDNLLLAAYARISRPADYEKLRSFAQKNKMKTGFSYRYSGLLWFCSNKPPRFGGDNGTWVYKRIILINCSNVIAEEEQDHSLVEKLYAERGGIVNKAIMALKETIDNGYRFSESEGIRNARDEYRYENSSVYQFIKDCMNERKNPGSVPKGDNATISMVYRVYMKYCKFSNNGYAVPIGDFKQGYADYLGMPLEKAVVRRGKGMYFAYHEPTEEAYANLLPSDAEVHRDLVFGRSVS